MAAARGEEEEEIVLKVTLNNVHKFMVVVKKNSSVLDLKSEISKVARLFSSTDLGETTSVQCCCNHELPDIYKVGSLVKKGDYIRAYTAAHVSNHAGSGVEKNAVSLERSSQHSRKDSASQNANINTSDSADTSKDSHQETGMKKTKDMVVSHDDEQECTSKRNKKEDLDKTFNACKDSGSGSRKRTSRLKISELKPVTSSGNAEKEGSNKRRKKSSGCRDKSSIQVQESEKNLNEKDGRSPDKIDEVESAQEYNEVHDGQDVIFIDEMSLKNVKTKSNTPRNTSLKERNDGTLNERRNLDNEMNLDSSRKNPKNRTQNIRKRGSLFQMENFALPLEEEEEHCAARAKDGQHVETRLADVRSTRKSESQRTLPSVVEQGRESRRKQRHSRTQSIDESLADENQINKVSESPSTSSKPSSIVSETIFQSQAFKEMLESRGCSSKRRVQTIKESVTKVAIWLVNGDGIEGGTSLIKRKSTEVLNDTLQEACSDRVAAPLNNNSSEDNDRIYPIIDILQDRVLYYDSNSNGGLIKKSYLSSCQLVIPKLNPTQYTDCAVMTERHKSTHGVSEPPAKDLHANDVRKESEILCAADCQDANEEDCGYGSHGVIGSSGSEDLFITPKLKHLMSYSNEPLPSNVTKPVVHAGKEMDDESCFSTEILDSEKQAHVDRRSSAKKVALLPDTNGATANETTLEEGEDQHTQVEKGQELGEKNWEEDSASSSFENERRICKETVDKVHEAMDDNVEDESASLQLIFEDEPIICKETANKGQELDEPFLEVDTNSPLEEEQMITKERVYHKEKRRICKETVDKGQVMDENADDESASLQLIFEDEPIICKETANKGQELDEQFLEVDTNSPLEEEQMITKERVYHKEKRRICKETVDKGQVMDENVDDESASLQFEDEPIICKETANKGQELDEQFLEVDTNSPLEEEQMITKEHVGHKEKTSTEQQNVQDAKATDDSLTVTNDQMEQAGWLSPRKKKNKMKSRETFSHGESMAESCVESTLSQSPVKHTSSNKSISLKDNILKFRKRLNAKNCSDKDKVKEDVTEHSLTRERKNKGNIKNIDEQANDKDSEIFTDKEEFTRDKSIQKPSATLQNIETAISEKSPANSPREETSIKERFANAQTTAIVRERYTSSPRKDSSIKERFANAQTTAIVRERYTSSPRIDSSIKKRFASKDPFIPESSMLLPPEITSPDESVTKDKSAKQEKKNNSKNKDIYEQTLLGGSPDVTAAVELQAPGQSAVEVPRDDIEQESFTEEKNQEKKKKKKKKEKYKERDKADAFAQETCEEKDRKEWFENIQGCDVDEGKMLSEARAPSVEDNCDEKKRKKEKKKRRGKRAESGYDVEEEEETSWTKKSGQTGQISRKEEPKTAIKVEQVCNPVLQVTEIEKIESCESSAITKKSRKRSHKDSEIPHKQLAQVQHKPVLTSPKAKNNEKMTEGERTTEKTKKETKRKEKNQDNTEKEDRDSEINEEIPKKKRKKKRQECEETATASQKGSYPDSGMFSCCSETEGNIPLTNVLSWISKKIKPQTTEKSSTKKASKSTLMDLAQDDQELSLQKTPLHSSTPSFTSRSSSMRSSSRIFHKTPLGFTNTVTRIHKKAKFLPTTVACNRRKRKLSTSLPQRRELTQEEKDILSGGVKRLEELLDNDSVWD